MYNVQVTTTTKIKKIQLLLYSRSTHEGKCTAHTFNMVVK